MASFAYGLFFKTGKYVHPGGIEPDKERFVFIGSTLDEILGRRQKFFIHCFHTLFGQWPGIFTHLFAPGAKTGHLLFIEGI